jgi:hypothetical protein
MIKASDVVNILRREGWQKYDIGAPNHPKCVMGAINYVGSGGETTDYAERYSDTPQDAAFTSKLVEIVAANEEWVERAGISVHDNDDAEFLAQWNNHDDTTFEDIISALELTSV